MPPKTRKIAVMGFRAVGKSSLVIRFVEDQFVDSYHPSIENTFEKRVKYSGQDFRIQLVDTAGQDEYSLFSEAHCVDVHGYVLVYSINSQKSFEVIKVIHDKILDTMGVSSRSRVPLVLVGNKTDLHMQRVISTEEGKRLADSWNAIFVESSAKQNEGVKDIFLMILMEVEKQYEGGGETKQDCSIL